MNQLWEWTATDCFGRSQKYQAYGPDVTEAGMLEHLAKHFRNVKITGLKRLEDGQFSPPTGEIESHTYHFGAYDAHLRSRGMPTLTDMLKRRATSILEPGNSILKTRTLPGLSPRAASILNVRGIHVDKTT